MNEYLIKFNNKYYATNADNIMDAEEKLFEYLGEWCYAECDFKVVSFNKIKDTIKDEVEFF